MSFIDKTEAVNNETIPAALRVGKLMRHNKIPPKREEKYYVSKKFDI
jgi:hypothetical protein